MIDPMDAVALSMWDEIPRRRLSELLRRDAAASAVTAAAVPLQEGASLRPSLGAAGDTSGEASGGSAGPASVRAAEAGLGPPLEALLARIDDSVDIAGLAGRLRATAERALERAAKAGVSVITWGSQDYPPRLAEIPDPPLVLWVRGYTDALSRFAVAIVGSRAASRYGLEVAASLARDLAGAGLVVVSGLARGVDGAAHRGALSGGGPTVAVLGCGPDVIYPPEHADLVAEIPSRGAVVSEYRPGTPPRSLLFPLRNRIISGLARGVVVVEAAERSGSLITAAAALDQGREVMAAPGSILTGRHRGAHALIRDGATLVTSAADVLAALGRLPFAPRPRRSSTQGPDTTASGDPVLDLLSPDEPSSLDDIAARTGMAPAALLARLLGLEVAGEVGRVEGGRFVRLGRTC